jgi:hypothetical protein
MMILAAEPLHVSSLRALARIEARQGALDGGRRFRELLAVAGALSEEELAELSASASDRSEAGELAGALDEPDHVRLAHPDAVGIAPVFSSLWEGSAGQLPGLESLGARPEDRISPVEDSPLARAYAQCARLLGNRKTGLYRRSTPEDAVLALSAQPPTAVVVGPSFAEGRSLGELRFLLGRALEIARPEYVLAAALDREHFTRLFTNLLQAFHPRHIRKRGGEGPDASTVWKRALPYKVARRLSELLRDTEATEFSSARWRRAVQHTGNRAGLMAAGDLVVAARMLEAEGDREAIIELARFAASDEYLALLGQSWGGQGKALTAPRGTPSPGGAR